MFRNSINLMKLIRGKKPSQSKSNKKAFQSQEYHLRKQIKIPNQYKRPMQYRKQVHNMQVPSQALSDTQQIKKVMWQHRKLLQQLDQASRVWSIPYLLSGITGINILGFTATLFYNKYYLGMWIAGILHPSFIISSAILIGYNTAFVIMRQALKMQISDSQLKNMQDLNLVSSSYQIWYHISLIAIQSALLFNIAFSNQLISPINDLYSFGEYAALSLLVLYQAARLVPKEMINAKKSVSVILISFCVLYGLYAISYLTPYQSIKDGIEEVQQKYKVKKVMIKKQPINIATNDDNDQ